jgi:plasmid stability protein
MEVAVGSGNVLAELISRNTGSDFSRLHVLALLSMIATSMGTVLSLIAGDWKVNMAQLVVRNLSDDLVKSLKQRAAKNNRSAEQEHREILKAALRGPRRRSLASVLASMPNVGKDEDFVRQQSDSRR